MKSPTHNNNKKLDELISQAIGRDKPEFDFDKWKQLHKKEIQIYESQTAGKQTTQSVLLINIWRAIMKSRITQLAAAAVIIITAFTTIHFLGGRIESVAFADVVQPVLEARTASFDVALESGNQPIQRSHFLCMSPGLIRQTMSDGVINIIDYSQHKAMTLNPNDMTAKLTWMVPRQEIGVSDILGQMQQRIERAIGLSDKSVEHLGRKLIDGQDAIGFRVQLSGEQKYVISWQGRGMFTIWANPQKKLPIRLEWYDEMFGINTVANNIELNIDLDESMFSMEIPEGYALSEEVEQEPEVEVPLIVDEQKIIDKLRDWVSLTDGRFPSSLSGYSVIKDLDPNADISFIQKGWKGFHGFVHVNLPSFKAFVKVMELMTPVGLIGPMPPDSDWHYAGKGVKFGDADTAIFWYRPKNSKTYRVIYGDLNVKDVAPENLPK